MVEGNERSAMPLRLHNVLLALAGRLDDTALAQARRLAARARAGEAAELITGALVAGRIPVRAAEQRELAALLAAAGADDWFAQQLVVDDAYQAAEHRFSDDGTAGAGVAEALAIVLQRLPDVRGVYAVWRNTVAGSVPGPMPQRLIMAEVGPDGSPLATAYRMDTALHRAGIAATVEAMTAAAPRSLYHGHALAAAERVGTGSAPAVEPAQPSGGMGGRPPTGIAAPVQHEPFETVYQPDRSYAEPEAEYTEPEPAVEQYAEPEPAVEQYAEPEQRQYAEPVAEQPEPQAPEREPEPVAEQVQEQEPEPAAPRQPEPAAYGRRRWTTGLPPIRVVEQSGGAELEPGELFWPQADPAAPQPVSPEPAAPQPVEPQPAPEQHAEPEPDAQSEPAPEARAEQTTELTASEMGMLRSAIAAGVRPGGSSEPTKITGAAEETMVTGAADQTQITDPAQLARAAVEFPAEDLDNPRLSVRDRELLRELHAELAKREREQAAQVRLNGWEGGNR